MIAESAHSDTFQIFQAHYKPIITHKLKTEIAFILI